MAEHGVDLAQGGRLLRHLVRRQPHVPGHVLERLAAVGQELVERRIEQAHGDREALHGLEDAFEVGLLHGEQALEGALALGGVRRQDHPPDQHDPVLGEEHVLGAAQADPLGAQGARGAGVAGVSALARTRRRRARSAQARTSTKAAAAGRRLGALEQVAQHLALPGRQLAGDHLAGGAVDRQGVALVEDPAADPHLPALLVDGEVPGADDARLAQAAGDHRRVGGHAAARGEDADRGVHADDVLGRGLLAHQQHRTPAVLVGHRRGPVGVEGDAAGGGARAGGQPRGQHAAVLLRLLALVQVELRREHLDQVARLDPGEALALLDQRLSRPCRRRSAPPPARSVCRSASGACRGCRPRP